MGIEECYIVMFEFAWLRASANHILFFISVSLNTTSSFRLDAPAGVFARVEYMNFYTYEAVIMK